MNDYISYDDLVKKLQNEAEQVFKSPPDFETVIAKLDESIGILQKIIGFEVERLQETLTELLKEAENKPVIRTGDFHERARQLEFLINQLATQRRFRIFLKAHHENQSN